mgnify:CR=1 FL=1
MKRFHKQRGHALIFGGLFGAFLLFSLPLLRAEHPRSAERGKKEFRRPTSEINSEELTPEQRKKLLRQKRRQKREQLIEKRREQRRRRFKNHYAFGTE